MHLIMPTGKSVARPNTRRALSCCRELLSLPALFLQDRIRIPSSESIETASIVHAHDPDLPAGSCAGFNYLGFNVAHKVRVITIDIKTTGILSKKTAGNKIPLLIRVTDHIAVKAR